MMDNIIFEAGHMGGGIELDIQQHELMLRFADRILRLM
jgi:hypothetical protein